jgi:uncharacterized membrane protein
VTAAPRVDPLAPWRPSASALAAFASLAAALLVYPFVLDRALARLGTRPVAASLATLAAATWLLPRRSGPGRRLELPRVPGFAAAVVALLAAAAVSGEVRLLRLVPAAVQLWLALLCAVSLREPIPMIERVARLLQPRAPDFIRPYCRVLTALWCALFSGSAAAIAALAFAGSPESWQSFSARWLWVLVAAIGAVEYVFRKLWFRYYTGSAVDRAWAALFPAERTERGRRSLEHIRRARAEMRAAGFTPRREAP